jgi:hypothetical protein
MGLVDQVCSNNNSSILLYICNTSIPFGVVLNSLSPSIYSISAAWNSCSEYSVRRLHDKYILLNFCSSYLISVGYLKGRAYYFRPGSMPTLSRLSSIQGNSNLFESMSVGLNNATPKDDSVYERRR